MDSDDEESSGTAASNKSTEASVSTLEQAEVVAEVDYGDEKLLAELAKLINHYFSWRRDHLGEPIIDGFPGYINCSASKYPQLLKFKMDEEAYHMKNNIFFSIQVVGKHECPIHQFDTPPKTDSHLWSVDQALFLIRIGFQINAIFTVNILVLVKVAFKSETYQGMVR